MLLDDVGHNALDGDRVPVDVFPGAVEYHGDPVDLLLAERRGFGDDFFGVISVAVRHPAKLLQEIRSTIRAAWALIERVAAAEHMPIADD